MPSIAVTVDGVPTATWAEEELAQIESLELPGGRMGGVRDVFPLRELVTHLLGAGARVTKVIGSADSLQISAESWTQSTEAPVLRLNRRGLLKFHWMASGGVDPIDQSSVKDVVGLHIATS